MRVSNWQPQKFDGEIIAASMDRLEEVGNVIASEARRRVPVGKSRPASKGGKEWTAREAGSLRRSIRVIKMDKGGTRKILVYAGSKKAFYARFVEYGTVKMPARPFLRPALNTSKSRIQGILRGGS